MIGANVWELLSEAFRQIAQDMIFLLPKIFIALIIFVVSFLLIKVLNISLRKILSFAELDRTVKKLTGFSLPFSLNNLLIFLADLGVALIAIYSVANVFLEAQYIQMVTEGLHYGARVLSIIVIAIFLFSIFGVVIGRIRVESRLRGYIWFIILLLITAMLVDITALSETVKNALTTGLSLGVGLSIGIFAVWFFFHDYLDKLILSKTSPKKERTVTEKS
ncbi:MAG: mechanosensitive ion channel family protein [Candidatus Bathyarchaeia archaeon]